MRAQVWGRKWQFLPQVHAARTGGGKHNDIGTVLFLGIGW